MPKVSRKSTKSEVPTCCAAPPLRIKESVNQTEHESWKCFMCFVLRDDSISPLQSLIFTLDMLKTGEQKELCFFFTSQQLMREIRYIVFYYFSNKCSSFFIDFDYVHFFPQYKTRESNIDSSTQQPY